MRIAVLGPLLIDAGDGPAALGGVRLRALLVRLALDAGRPVPPQVLAEDLWPDEPDPLASGGALQSLTSRLRRSLPGNGAALVDRTPAGYRLAVDRGDVDALRFEELAAAGRRALADGEARRAADLLADGLRLWRGTALADVRQAPFAPAAAERLERLRVAAVEDRIDAELRLAPAPVRLGEIVEELRTLTAGLPLRERPHVLLLQALAGAGRAAEALAHYEQVRRTLADELGSDPSSALRAVHARLLGGPTTRAGRPPGQTPSAPDRAPARPAAGNLPAPVSSFVGRAADVTRVTSLVTTRRLVTLVGPGGAGKTRLAVETARHLVGDPIGELVGEPVGDGAWLVELAAVTRPDDVPGAVVAALDAREVSRREVSRREPAARRPPVGAQPLDRLTDVLAGRRLLLVLDNCEHVLDAAAALAEHLLARCPELRLLATSREPLRVPGEQLHPVAPLEVPEPGASVEGALRAPAVALLADRAAAVDPGFTVDPGSLDAVVEICRRLDGLPLAIELAAARLRSLPVHVVAGRLDDRFRLLTRGSRTALPRHQTLRAVVAWSWDLLETSERVLLERLAVLPGGFTEEAARAAAGRDRQDDVGDLLAALVDKSLLHPLDPVGTVARYRLLETIREYGVEQLVARGELERTRVCFTHHYRDVVEAAEPVLRGADQLAVLDRLEAEHANVLAAVGWAVAAGDGDAASRLGAALGTYWTVRGTFGEALSTLDAVLSGPALPPGDASAMVLTMYCLSAMATGRPVTDGDVARVRDALDGLDAISSPPLLALAPPALAILTGDTAEGVAFVERHADHPDPWARAALRLLEGVMAENAGEVERASAALPVALAGFRELGDRWGMATALASLGELLPLSGRDDEAIGALEEAIRYSAELGAFEDAAHLQLRVVQLLTRRGDVAAARARLTQLQEPDSPLLPVHRAGTVELAHADLDAREGRADVARARALEALSVVEAETGMPPQVTALALITLARLDAEEGHPDRAAEWLRHPRIPVVLTWDMPVSARIAVTAAQVRLAAGDAVTAAELLGLGLTLRGVDDVGDEDARRAAEDSARVLGAQAWAEAHARGTALPRARAVERLTELLGPDQARRR